MKRLLLSLALLYSLSSLAGIPYLIQPTNAPGLVGQQLFSVGNGYSWWDWSTNAASSNSTVISASTSVGVTTNGFNFTPFLSAGVTNWVNAQDTVVSNGVYGLFNGGTNITFGYARSLGAADTNNDTVVSNAVFNLLNDGTNNAYAYSRSIGVLATNQDLKTSNTLWLMITNVYVDVGGNGGTTNRSGQNVTFTVVPGSGGSATNAIDNNNGNGTNTTLWTKIIFTNATLQSSLVWDGTTLTQQGGTNVSTVSNLLVSGWTLLQGAETNSSITGPGFVFIDANGKRSAGTFSTGLLLTGSTLTATNTGTGAATNSIYGGVFGTNVDTGQLVIDAHGNFAQYGTNASMFQLKDTSSNVWYAATSSNTTVTINGTMNLASAGFTNANFLNPPYMSGVNITNVYASNIVSGGQLPLGTVSTGMVSIGGPFLTTNGVARSYTYNASALTNSDGGGLASTNYVINLVSSLGANVYSSGVTNALTMTNNAAGEFGYRTNIWQGQASVPTVITTNTISTLVLNAYVRHYVSTNKYSTISAGPVSIVAYLYRTGGGGTVSGHYEFYAVDSVTGQMTELASSTTHVIPDNVPTLHQFPLSVATDYTPPNPLYTAVAFKIDSVGSGGPTLSFVSGSNYDGHMSFARPLSSATITMSQVSGLAAALTDTTNNAAAVTNYVKLNNAEATNEVTRATTAGTVAMYAATYQLATNAAGAAFSALGGCYQTNLSGDITLAAFSNVPTDKVWGLKIYAAASGADRKVTFPAGCVGDPGAALPIVFYVTNNASAWFDVIGVGAQKTNVFWRPSQ